MTTLLKITKLNKSYQKNNINYPVLTDISFTLKQSDSLGIIGKSGSGKTTLANLITRLELCDSGNIYFDNQDITKLSPSKMKAIYQKMQLIFQLPTASFDPRKTIGQSIIEPMLNYHYTKQIAQNRLSDLLVLVGLEPSIQTKYPHQLSGGQCQRCAIARAISINPQLLICDEITSALDTISQQEILKLLQKLQKELNLSIIFISHDLQLVQKLCNKIIVLDNGKIIKQGNIDTISLNL